MLYEVRNLRLFLQLLLFIIFYVCILFSSRHIKQRYPCKGLILHDFCVQTFDLNDRSRRHIV